MYGNLRTSFLTKFVHSWLSEVRSVKLLSWDQSQDSGHNKTERYTILVKILTVGLMITALHDGRAECCLNYRIYTILALSVNFKWNACKKINVIAKISCCFERSVVTLKLRKEYLNTVTHNTPVLLQIKYWTVWYIKRYSLSYIRQLQTEKQSGFWPM